MMVLVVEGNNMNLLSVILTVAHVVEEFFCWTPARAVKNDESRRLVEVSYPRTPNSPKYVDPPMFPY